MSSALFSDFIYLSRYLEFNPAIWYISSVFSGQCQALSRVSSLLKLIITGDLTGEHLVDLARAGDIEQYGPFSAG